MKFTKVLPAFAAAIALSACANEAPKMEKAPEQAAAMTQALPTITDKTVV